MTESKPRNRLTSVGIVLPQIGFGASGLGNLFRAISDEEARDTVTTALNAGISYFDTAPFYGFGLSEQRLGDVLAAASRPTLVSTKIGRTLVPLTDGSAVLTQHGFEGALPQLPVFDYSRAAVYESFESSCRRLKREKIDILLAHDLGATTHGAEHLRRFAEFIEGGYQAMLELKRSGDIHAIGLGVNEWQVCEQVLDVAEVDCFLLAGRYTLLDQSALDTFFPRCEAKGIPIISGGPFNSGILALGTRGAHAAHFDYQRVPVAVLARVQRMEMICERYGVELAAAALQFPLGHPAVSNVLPGLGNAAQVDSSMRLLDQKIPFDFWNDLREAKLIRSDAPVPSPRILDQELVCPAHRTIK